MKRRVFTVAVFVLLWATAGCANKTPLVSTPVVPAAVGEVKLSTDDNNNTKVKVEVKYLAPPSALSPPRNAYVVWTWTGSGNPEKQGVLQIGDNRKGEIEFITPAQNFDVIVTAEESADVRYPSSTIAMQTGVSR
ncbi:MAG: hypothetical protein EHM23_08670 [Acidobacteria bacterium]|nr:MAG: hypothetical protein EHM23_08670 [Acidobacteriota bacterium]